jgi:UDP-glucuronate decarboxylase
MKTKKNILITGGLGFIGTNLAERLLQRGHYVILLDNLLTGSVDNFKYLSEKYGEENLKVILSAVENPENFDIHVDEIYNLACPASPKHYQADPIQTMKTCVIGAINVLDLAKKCNAKILHASTSEVYGDPKVHPQPESYWGNVNPCGIRSCYDEGKRAAESLFLDHHRKYNTDIRVVRIFNTYGPRMCENDGRVFQFHRSSIKR